MCSFIYMSRCLTGILPIIIKCFLFLSKISLKFEKLQKTEFFYRTFMANHFFQNPGGVFKNCCLQIKAHIAISLNWLVSIIFNFRVLLHFHKK